MKHFFLSFITIILSVVSIQNSSAQDVIQPCGSGLIHDQMMNNPSYRRAIERIDNRSKYSNLNKAATVYTLPVVVHVIHEGELLGQGSNISDLQVQSAIAALNEDFRKVVGTNGDGAGVDVELNFCLASRDPNGNSTNGIVRVDGSGVANYAEQGIESSGGNGAVEEDVKALSTWPREDYINIWIVNEIEDNDASGGVQGYAYFPFNNPVDGIVVLHNAFGTVGNLKPNTDENRVLTHEMGHYFSLYHTFHTTATCDSETNCTSQGDRICDTPPTILNASCNSPACSATQQVENYMDYTPETCRDMFTQGQKDRMRDALLNDRASLIESFGCVPATELDAGISSITSPFGSTCENNIQALVMLTNYGATTLTSVEINYGNEGNLNQSYLWTGSLNQGSSTEVLLPGFAATNGAHIISIETVNPNNQADEYSANDNLSSTYTISPGTPLLLEVTLDFYGSETTWEIVDSEGEIVTFGGPYPDLELGAVYQEFICAPTGCYTLIFHDDFGDGMGFVNGEYTLFDADDSVIFTGGGNFGSTETTDFCFVQVVPEGEAPIADFAISDNTICEGQSISFTDASLNSPTTWSWDFEGANSTSSTQQNPSAITYPVSGTFDVTLTATNEYGSSSSTLTINVEANPTVSLTPENTSCFGINDGNITSFATGNSLTYQWNNSSTTNNLTNIGQGNYTLTVTTPNGCSASSSTAVNAPDQIAIEMTGQNISCNGINDGEINTSSSGGTGAYNYNWNSGDNSENLTNLSPGFFALTVTDDNDCQATSTITLTQPQELEINLIDFDISCNGGLGSAQVSPAGGNGNYQTTWSTGGTENTVSNLTPGTYSVSVSDSEGCTTTGNFEIIESAALSVNSETTDITCFGMADGSVNILAQGGEGDYTYTWTNGFSGPTMNNLTTGTYTVNVEDEAGCQGSVTFQITSPTELLIEVTTTNISCAGREDGAATVSSTGGTGTIDYLWSTGVSGQLIEELGAETISVSAQDEMGCIATEIITISEPDLIQITTEVITEENCEGNNGSALASAEGGVGELTFAWNNGTADELLENVSTGIYDIVVTDENECVESESVFIGYNCDDVPTASTKLIEEDCGRNELSIEDFVSCISINDSEMYEWKFVNSIAGIFYEGYTIGNNYTFQLENVAGIYYDLELAVSIRYQKNGSWSAYGEVCTIYMKSDTPAPILQDSYCGATEHFYNDILVLNPISGAEKFEWAFSSLEPFDTTTIVSFTNQIYISESYGLLEDVNYLIQSRVKVGPNWSNYSSPCPFIIKSVTETNYGINDVSNFNIYPNPNNGENLFIDLGNLFESENVLSIELLDAQGKLIEFFDIVPIQETTEIINYNFITPLAPGLYFIRYTHKGDTNEKKLIVQ